MKALLVTFLMMSSVVASDKFDGRWVIDDTVKCHNTNKKIRNFFGNKHTKRALISDRHMMILMLKGEDRVPMRLEYTITEDRVGFYADFIHSDTFDEEMKIIHANLIGSKKVKLGMVIEGESTRQCESGRYVLTMGKI